MTNYRRGADFERKVKKDYEDNDWFVIRSAGSKGPVDLVAIRFDAGQPTIELIQCKTRKPTKKERKDFNYFLFTMQVPAYWGLLIWPDGEERISEYGSI